MENIVGKIKAKSGFIIDMDGVIYHGNKLLPGIPEFLKWLEDSGKKFLFLTNSSERSPRELHEKLMRLGLDVGEEHFYTSALATAGFLASQKPNGSAFIIGDAGLIHAMYSFGYTINNVNPDYVVVGDTRNYNFENIRTAVNLVLRGARLIGANPDISGPVENGIIPSTKALIAPIEIATGKKAYFWTGILSSPQNNIYISFVKIFPIRFLNKIQTNKSPNKRFEFVTEKQKYFSN